MVLMSYESRWRDDITHFVNVRGIKRENIQEIVYDVERKCFNLFYWSTQVVR